MASSEAGEHLPHTHLHACRYTTTTHACKHTHRNTHLYTHIQKCPFLSLHLQIAELVATEFYAQGDRERCEFNTQPTVSLVLC